MTKQPATRFIRFVRIFLLIVIIIGGILIVFQKQWVPPVVAYLLSIEGRSDYELYDPASPKGDAVPVPTVPSTVPADLVNASSTEASGEVVEAPVATEQWSADLFTMPDEPSLRSRLTPLQYSVTQEDGTETPYNNLYNKNYEEGIYVDIVSGEPLFLSKDKYESGTGWPSFVKPISDDAVVLKSDYKLFVKRTDVRSRYADSHLGHVFNDGPDERGGKRYCMNSAALRFIATRDMVKEGYAYLLPQVK